MNRKIYFLKRFAKENRWVLILWSGRRGRSNTTKSSGEEGQGDSTEPSTWIIDSFLFTIRLLSFIHANTIEALLSLILPNQKGTVRLKPVSMIMKPVSRNSEKNSLKLVLMLWIRVVLKKIWTKHWRTASGFLS